MRLRRALFVVMILMMAIGMAQAKGVVEMVNNLHWLGHDGFRLDASKVIYFDPYKLSPGSKKADIILITHEHFDHYSPADIKLISTAQTVIISDGVSAQQMKSALVICKEIKALTPGQKIEVSGVSIEAVPSYNVNKQFHTRDSKKIGYIVNVDGARIYHAGDTDFIPEMKNIRCDIALLPVSGTYVMTVEEAVQAALAIKPKIAIPMHYGSIVGNEADARRFQDLLKGKVEVRILKKEN